MKVIFMGTPTFAVPTLLGLLGTHEVVAVVTQPDKAKGRGKTMQVSPVKQVALDHHVPVLQFENMSDPSVLAELEAFGADVFVVVAYGQILPQPLLDLPKFGCINVHGSLLPALRGAAPIHWAIINGETKTGVTIMYMDKGLDTGDMILKAEIDILPTDNTGTLHEKMADVGAKALLDALVLLENGTAKPVAQNHEARTYAPKVTKEMGRINWQNNCADIEHLVRGLAPVPCASTTLLGQVVKIHQVQLCDNGQTEPVGTVVGIGADGLVVQAGDGTLVVTHWQAQGGKPMSLPDFLRGHDVAIGTVLGS